MIETLLTTCTWYSQLEISSLFLFTKKYFDGQTDPKRNKKDEASEEAERKKWSDHFSENIQHVMRDNLIDAIIIVYIINVDLHYHGTTSRGEKTNKSCMRKKKEQT